MKRIKRILWLPLFVTLLFSVGCPQEPGLNVENPPVFSPEGPVLGSGTEKTSALSMTAMPFKLAGDTDVKNVKITWSALAHAERYEVYCDGSIAGTATGDTWDVYGLGLGSHSFNVKAYKGTAVIAESTPMTANAFSRGLPTTTWNNTQGGNSLGVPEGVKTNDNKYYRYVTSGSPGTVTISEEVSDTGTGGWSSNGTIATYDNSRFEGVGYRAHPTTGKIIYTAHYENSTDYTLGYVFIAEITPGVNNSFIEKFKGNPCGLDCRDMSVFIDNNDEAYILAEVNTNTNVAIFKLNGDWNDFEENGLLNIVFRGQNREPLPLSATEITITSLAPKLRAGTQARRSTPQQPVCPVPGRP
jgi:hypothetical protein